MATLDMLQTAMTTKSTTISTLNSSAEGHDSNETVTEQDRNETATVTEQNSRADDAEDDNCNEESKRVKQILKTLKKKQCSKTLMYAFYNKMLCSIMKQQLCWTHNKKKDDQEERER